MTKDLPGTWTTDSGSTSNRPNLDQYNIVLCYFSVRKLCFLLINNLYLKLDMREAIQQSLATSVNSCTIKIIF